MHFSDKSISKNNSSLLARSTNCKQI